MTTEPTLSFIGRIRTPWRRADECPRNGLETEEICRIEVDESYRAGLASLESCSHAIVLYWLDRARRDVLTLKPPNDDTVHGVFALRAPMRPNPIGISVVDIVEVAPDGVLVRHIDCLDDTPLIDIKPYFASTDSRPEAHVGWHERRSTPLPPLGRAGPGRR